MHLEPVGTMSESTKYVIHLDVTAEGVVERSDVVGAIFGQTEGLIGDDLNLHDLQQRSKVGRIDVSVQSELGESTGEIRIASAMDKVETAVLAAAIETIDRIGPCRATIHVSRIEDVRAATRRSVVDRAHEILATSFDDTVMSSEDVLESVRERIRVDDIDDYDGYPAGPNVATSDAIIVVEGRADVLRLLQFGIKNAIAVEGTNIPDSIATLTRERTTTAFLDGDRGGELILKELNQVGSIDSVAFAPPGRSVEELSQSEIFSALRQKVSWNAEPPVRTALQFEDQWRNHRGSDLDAPTDDVAGEDITTDFEDPQDPDDAHDKQTNPSETQATLIDQVHAIVSDNSQSVRLLDTSFKTIAEGANRDVHSLVSSADQIPHTIVIDGVIDQRLLDIAAQCGVSHIVGRDRGEYTKQPVSVKISTVEELGPTSIE